MPTHADIRDLAQEVHDLAAKPRTRPISRADLERLALRVDAVDPALVDSLRALLVAGVENVMVSTLLELRDGLGRAASAAGRRSWPAGHQAAVDRAAWLVALGHRVMTAEDPEFLLGEKTREATEHRVGAIVAEARALVADWGNLLDPDHDRRAAALALITAGSHLTRAAEDEAHAVKLLVHPSSGGDQRALVMAYGSPRLLDADVAEALGIAWIRDPDTIEALYAAAPALLAENEVLVQAERHVVTRVTHRVLDLDEIAARAAEETQL